ncbi:hypothetical protein Tdes44962_MAKER00973 [Teratosphaeria destructans]|uniref:Pentapeptide repeat-containing protein n=1 Tax=Teratosphaeria destructans TaxID=418781 RepID=A0A9W7SJJ2_9PEZI|nr:hypothetical protein Tdes44962_MAKER00973 [Teratosphaeria destructans]
MATTTPDCRSSEDIILQKMERVTLTDGPASAKPTIAPQTVASAEEEDEHDMTWMSAKPAGFHASGTFFCVRIQHCVTSHFRLNVCFHQDVKYTACEIDGLTLNNCLFDNVIFEDCSFYNVTLHHICLRNVVFRNIAFVDYLWTDEEVVNGELGLDSLKSVRTGSRLGGSIPSDIAGVDWITRASATAAAPSQSDEELARRLDHELNGETDTWNAWENASGACIKDPQRGWTWRHGSYSSSVNTTQWRDQTNENIGAGPARHTLAQASFSSRLEVADYPHVWQ